MDTLIDEPIDFTLQLTCSLIKICLTVVELDHSTFHSCALSVSLQVMTAVRSYAAGSSFINFLCSFLPHVVFCHVRYAFFHFFPPFPPPTNLIFLSLSSAIYCTIYKATLWDANRQQKHKHKQTSPQICVSAITLTFFLNLWGHL